MGEIQVLEGIGAPVLAVCSYPSQQQEVHYPYLQLQDATISEQAETPMAYNDTPLRFDHIHIEPKIHIYK